MNLQESLTAEMELAAIWLENPIWKIDKNKVGRRTVRIEKGDKIPLMDGKIVYNEKCTHKVIRCIGNVENTILYFELENLVTEEKSKLIVK